MKPLYITAVVTYSGKTALALGIGLKLQAMGKKVGYFKPISTQPYRVDGKLVDEDADFVARQLGLSTPAADLAPVVIDEVLFDKILSGSNTRNFLDEARGAYQRAGEGKDVLLIEGGSSLREGYAVGVSPIALVEVLNLPTLGVVRYRSGITLVDDVLSLLSRVDANRNPTRMAGVVINSVPTEAMDQVQNKIRPFLERQGLAVMGVLPSQKALMSVSVEELVQVMGGKILVPGRADTLIENLSVGAMSVEAAMNHFRRTQHKVVITGGDRADIQAAALETSTSALVLTGNLQPSSIILKAAEERNVAVLLVPYNTIEAVERAEKVFGRTRLAHPEKLNRFREMLDAHLNWDLLFKTMGL
jgi:uncharacterized protein